jgi:hypothetical protein
MRSVPVALIWELLFCGRWYLLAGALGGLVFPLMLLGALSGHGPIDSVDPSLIGVHMIMIQLSTFIFCAALVAAQRQPSRLYCFPVSSAAIALWTLLPSMLLTGIYLQLSSLLINWLFRLNWPFWGPSLFAVVTYVAVQAIVWRTEKSAWVIWGLIGVMGFLGSWLKARYGSLFSQPDHFWVQVTPWEVVTLLALVAGSIFTAIRGIERSRCGELIPPLGIVAWVLRLLDPVPAAQPAFRSSWEAQAWVEWYKKGIALPIAAGLAILGGMLFWSIFSRRPVDLIDAYAVGGALLSILAVVGGMINGNLGPNDQNYELGHFMGTRPITSRDLARIVLLNTAKSVLCTWLVWISAFAVFAGIIFTLGVAPTFKIPKELGWWFFPATLFGPWIVASVGASIGLAGRVQLFVVLFCAALCLMVGGQICSEIFLSPAAREQLAKFEAIACGVAFVVLTVWLFAAALKRSLVERQTAYFAAAAWFLLSVGVVVEWKFIQSKPLGFSVFVIGLLALAAAPLAAAPLALTWNRNR